MAPIVHIVVLPTYKCKKLDRTLSIPIAKQTNKKRDTREPLEALDVYYLDLGDGITGVGV